MNGYRNRKGCGGGGVGAGFGGLAAGGGVVQKGYAKEEDECHDGRPGHGSTVPCCFERSKTFWRL